MSIVPFPIDSPGVATITETAPDEGAAPSGLPTLPSNVEQAIPVIQAHIDAWRARLFPNADQVVANVIDTAGAAPDPALLEQREKLADLGLDPDILAPLPVRKAPVASYVGYMTFPRESVERWATDAGFGSTDIANILAAVDLVPPVVVEQVAQLEDGIVEVNGGPVDVILDPGRVSPVPLADG